MEEMKKAAYSWSSLTHTELANEAKGYPTVGQSTSEIGITPSPEPEESLSKQNEHS
jgi:hypothetical protein